MVDAVVIGAGPNGLVAANLLADAGWEVALLEARPSPGGGVASAGYLGDGWVTDVCSAFYPLAAVSPVVSGLGLEHHGLRWSHAPAVLAHPRGGDRAAVLWRDVEATAAGFERDAAGDGRAWKGLHRLWERVGGSLLDALFTPFPPLRAAARLGRELGAGGALRLARFAALPVRRLAQEEFRGEAAGLLLAGCALHADFFPESAASAFFGWLLAMLGHHAGFPVAEGGAARLTAALVDRFEARGGTVLCDHPVARVEVRGGRAVGVLTAGGGYFPARRAVLADVPAPHLYGGLVGWEHLPPAMAGDVRRFQWDWSTVKLDWALAAPVPWEATEVSGAGTVHLASSLDELTRYSSEIARGLVPAEPFVLAGQLSTADPTRSPPGTEVLYAYTHVPRTVAGDAAGGGSGSIRGTWDAADLESMADRVEARIERFAPGFRSLIRRRHLLGPAGLEAHDPNLVGGAVNGGTAAPHQQLFFRPLPGLGRPETPVEGLYLASSSAHPGGGVHGACGSNAARAALMQRSALHRVLVAPALSRVRRSLQRPLTGEGAGPAAGGVLPPDAC